MTADDYAWPPVTADVLRASLTATTTADDKAAMERAMEVEE